MKRYDLTAFGFEHLNLVDVPAPQPGVGEVKLAIRALSINSRDVRIVTGAYNPRMSLPATPLSDGAGVVTAVGEGVSGVQVGDRVMSHFVSTWLDGPYRGAYLQTTLGTPGPGLACEEVVLSADAVVPIPDGYDFAQAATLPIAGLTAWSALVTEGKLTAGQSILTLGTGGVSIFALQIAKTCGARVLITSSSDDKLARAKALGADATINYVSDPRWDKRVLELTDGTGVDVVVENGGIKTLEQSLRAVRAGGVVALLGALTGMQGEVNIAPIVMRRLRVAGVLVDSRKHFAEFIQFINTHHLEPVIDARFRFEQLPEALRHMAAGRHFGKIVIER